MATAAHKIDLGKAVAAYGSFTALATRLDVHLSTVHGWHQRKRIPLWRAKEIATVAAEDGFDVIKKSRRRSVR
jgi:hypothetical protein